MSGLSTMAKILAGADEKIRRQVGYWAGTVLLYSLCLGLLWLGVWYGDTTVRSAGWLTACILTGILLFYLLIRASGRLKLTPAQLAAYQGIFAIVCVVAAYAIASLVRGASLSILLVILVFCAFALDAKKSHRMSLFAIVLLAGTMVWMMNADPVRFQPMQELVHFLLAAGMLVAVAYLTGQLNLLRTRLKAQKAELSEALVRIQTLATRDELTSLANRRHMSELLAKEERQHITQGRPVCIALLDIDWFKRINDTYGHAAGDQVLRSFAQAAQGVLRATDVLARWGGEEFLLLLPDTRLQDARPVLERVKGEIATLRFACIAPELRISFSGGLIELGDVETVNDGVSRADHAMYEAKAQGRNCVVVADA